MGIRPGQTIEAVPKTSDSFKQEMERQLGKEEDLGIVQG
jgi:hypothetical protein